MYMCNVSVEETSYILYRCFCTQRNCVLVHNDIMCAFLLRNTQFNLYKNNRNKPYKFLNKSHASSVGEKGTGEK